MPLPYSLPLPPGFSLRDTLLCGQCFRWAEGPDGTFTGFAGRRAAALRQEGDTLLLSDPDTDFWANYLDLGEDYGRWIRSFARDPALAAAAAFCGGIRILRQDPWEALVSFIISANNNIPRIKGIIARLCGAFGEEGGFPAPDRLARETVESLSCLRAGFRAKYILDAAGKAASGELDLGAVAALPLPEAEAALRRVNGVGPKVAQCVLLYGFHRLDAFPVDTWMKKALARYYPDGFPGWISPRGVAQQVLFHYIRHIDMDSPKGGNGGG